MTINVGAGGRAQQFAQTMAIANVQKEMIAGGKTNLVGHVQLYNTAAELARIMGHKNPDKFLNDPGAIDPRTGQLLHPPPAAPALPPDPNANRFWAACRFRTRFGSIKSGLHQGDCRSNIKAQIGGITSRSVAAFQKIYEGVARDNPSNLSAVHRAALLANILMNFQ